MKFKGGRRSFDRKASGGRFMLIAAGLVLIPGILIWVLLGEFNVLNLDYLHAEGAATGICFADTTSTTPISCAAGTQVLLYNSSHVDWRMAVAVCSLLVWSLVVCSVFCLLHWTNERIFPYVVATSVLVIVVAFSAAIPHANDSLLIFVRVIVALVGAAFGFLVTNLITNAIVILTKRGAPVYEQMAKEVSESKTAKERAAQKSKSKGTGNDKDYVEDIKR